MKKILNYLLFVAAACAVSCTNLDETVYSEIGTTNFIQSKDDVIALAMRPFGHASWVASQLTEVQESSADHWVTYTINGEYWGAGGYYARLHKHGWTIDDDYVNGPWVSLWAGIVQLNNVLDVLEGISPEKYNISETEFSELYEGSRAMRAWFYIKLFDLYRNLPLYRSVKDESKNTDSQVSPEKMFEFIESELLDALGKLPAKAALGGNGAKQMLWNKGGAASLLVRLYLNSEKWTGVDRYDLCAGYAQRIIDGEYGPYALDDVWDEPFKWNNITSDELIYAFESNKYQAHNHYDGDHFGWAFPVGGPWTKYFLFSEFGDPNFRFGLAPGLDVDYKEYPYQQGKPYRKFQKYPSDYRLKLYKNLGNGEREGMFLFGYIPNLKEGGYLKQIDGTTDLYIRDQAGFFHGAKPGEIIDDKRSGVEYADENSGTHMVKYPFYPDSDGDKIFEADYAEIRLAEIYYSLAECKLRAGDALAAGDLLNKVRKRNYPETDWSKYLYQGKETPSGSVQLDMAEMLDEWGREFIGELRRRTDLCRFGKFTDVWWDKTDTDPTRDIFPLSRTALAANPKLKQNPGYETN